MARVGLAEVMAGVSSGVASHPMPVENEESGSKESKRSKSGRRALDHPHLGYSKRRHRAAKSVGQVRASNANLHVIQLRHS